MGRSCETQGKKSSEVKGRKLQKNESVWDKTKSTQQKPQGKHGMRQDGMKWVGMQWERMEKNYQKWIIKAKLPNSLFMFQKIALVNSEKA